ncbi:toll/interleukin-1 receptor domain-containing protein [Acinetobacter sp. ANC 3791]|uniref:toll/interleukin-1 receptor domain-containing protein n=1 Tax=Acinetobacter sp. ANC 3791 TaxID=2529836 RepID=UPI00103A524D|nr:toll/interleukin-1 receptor domain-containing protein [Acinetobacter sp. ANC 3791]TCB84845.1 hypothetical protein E0H90_06650 [Acinetobacter sp. ANC 3791]
MNFFICYTLRDNILTQSDFEKIRQYFSKNGECFIHFFHPEIDSQKKIEDEILNSDILILIRTEKSFSSPWVLMELKLAKKISIPIFYISIEDLRDELSEY